MACLFIDMESLQEKLFAYPNPSLEEKLPRAPISSCRVAWIAWTTSYKALHSHVDTCHTKGEER